LTHDDLESDAELAPAKVNLFLHVTGKRPDGYHLLDSMVVFAGIADRVAVTPAEELSLAITGPFALSLAAEPDNLVLRAARTLAAEAGVRATGALRLDKQIPVASGIGGGSADAAAALRCLAKYGGWTRVRRFCTALPSAWGLMCRCAAQPADAHARGWARS